jgi:hypothetical protein
VSDGGEFKFKSYLGILMIHWMREMRRMFVPIPISKLLTFISGPDVGREDNDFILIHVAFEMPLKYSSDDINL